MIELKLSPAMILILLRQALCGFLLAAYAYKVQAQTTASWIWHAEDEAQQAPNDPRYFRCQFESDTSPEKLILELSADNQATVYLNGQQIGQCRDWQRPLMKEVGSFMVKGTNILAVRANNEGGMAGLVARMTFKSGNKVSTLVVSDQFWRSSQQIEANWMTQGFDDSHWKPVALIGPVGTAPWGDIFNPPSSTSAEDLEVITGFAVEHLLSADRSQGSWIAMTFDAKGRLIVSPQSDNDPMLRISQQPDGQWAVEPFATSRVRHAMGLLHAHQSLYISGHGPEGTGLYRWVDRNKDDKWTDDESMLLKPIRGEGEHGYHGLRLGPDNLIYMMNGNHTQIIEGIAGSSPHQHYGEDHLLPRQWDANGHATGIMAPGGYVARTDAEGKDWELIMGGFRNAYDFDFNTDGELFTFDSDMEWDWGTPWYRPTRVIHGVSGGEYGWRSGTSKWPSTYPDSLPATLDIGIGSPTGVCFGTGAAFPERYQRALYIMDWSYGRILAVHMEPWGASYRAAKETFIKGRPLNVSDMEIGPDGCLYFIVGGRGTQSGLYRVRYVGSEATQPVTVPSSKDLDSRMLRRSLESYHGKVHPMAVDQAWPHLRSRDQWIRHAARIAIESQPLEKWQDRALAETHLRGGLTALMALARTGGDAHRATLHQRLRELADKLTQPQDRLLHARVLQLAIIRLGRPDEKDWQLWTQSISETYPSSHTPLNRELAQLAAYFNIPGSLEVGLQLMADAKHQEEQLHYLFTMRHQIKDGNLDQLRRYFSWFNQSQESRQQPPNMIQWFFEADRSITNGASYSKFLERIREEALVGIGPREQKALSDILEGGKVREANQQPNPILQRSAFTAWSLEAIKPHLDGVNQGRQYEQGKLAYEAAQCGTCHRFGDAGGAVGPDLTAVGSRFTPSDVLDSILHPSKVLSEQYAYETFVLEDEESITGRVMSEDKDQIMVQQNPYASDVIALSKSKLIRRSPSLVSPMPEGLIDILKLEEVLDLLAYLNSGGNADHEAFKP